MQGREALKVYGRQALSTLQPQLVGDVKVFSGAFTGLDRKLLMERASELVATGSSVAALVSKDDKTFLVLARSSDIKLDCASLLNQVLSAYGGRGGGKPEFASGGTPGQVDVDDLLRQVGRLLESSI
jgi:alanyl-tRNA synthetase